MQFGLPVGHNDSLRSGLPEEQTHISDDPFVTGLLDPTGIDEEVLHPQMVPVDSIPQVQLPQGWDAPLVYIFSTKYQ